MMKLIGILLLLTTIARAQNSGGGGGGGGNGGNRPIRNSTLSTLDTTPSPNPTLKPTRRPTKNPTPAPTEPSASPTDSPAPSPSPSETPTNEPTSTEVPTPVPSITPTDSPAPSPSPTSMPSASPSDAPTRSPSESPSSTPSEVPSENPSGVPSVSPSMSPTFSPTFSPSESHNPSSSPSEEPSAVPSLSPSAAPTMAPTISMVPTSSPSVSPSREPTATPSEYPSGSPTISDQPSSLPSFTPTGMPTRDQVTLITDMEMTFTDLKQPLTVQELGIFAEQTRQFITQHGESLEGHVIEAKTVVVEEQMYIPARRLEQETFTRRSLHEAGLRIKFNATCEIRPGTLSEDFDFDAFISNLFEEHWLMYIYRLSSANPAFNPLIESNNELGAGENGDDDFVGTVGFIGVIVAAVAVVALAVVVSIFAIRTRRDYPSSVGSSEYQVDVYDIEQCESGSTAMTPRSKLELESPIQKSAIMHPMDEVTPPAKKLSDASEFAKTKSLLDAMVRSSATGDDESEAKDDGQDVSVDRDDEALGLKLTSDVLAVHASEVNRVDPPGGDGKVKGIRDSFDYSTDDEIENGRSLSLWTPTSAHSTGSPTTTTPGGFLGARPLYASEQNQFEEEDDDDVPLKRTGLYDVFAPSGQLGIVVDTTKDGPIVHSLKATSPLLGLISPGDLIVGLDDTDTRSMTAATLTRTMAKRAQQPERKITLLAVPEPRTPQQPPQQPPMQPPQPPPQQPPQKSLAATASAFAQCK